MNQMPQNPLYLPANAALPVNRCNLPAKILGGLSFQAHPISLYIDGVAQLHAQLYQHLDTLDQVEQRRQRFMDYMTVQFSLQDHEPNGYQAHSRLDRRRANYLNVLMGWFFDSNSVEAAVLKAWVESRFGLLTRFHKKLLRQHQDDNIDVFLEDYCRGLYNTNALESQLDLLYSYCQYELKRQRPGHRHCILYRGINNPHNIDTLALEGKQRVALLNNVNSFSTSADRAGEFGDYVFSTLVPRSKIIYFTGLLPLRTHGEGEVISLGGLFRLKLLPL